MARNNKVKAAFHEVFTDVPKTVKKSGKTGESKRKMMVAIALSKARKAGAKIPKKRNPHMMDMAEMGGVSKSTSTRERI